jgi:hypothetical protein
MINPEPVMIVPALVLVRVIGATGAAPLPAVIVVGGALVTVQTVP